MALQTRLINGSIWIRVPKFGPMLCADKLAWAPFWCNLEQRFNFELVPKFVTDKWAAKGWQNRFVDYYPPHCQLPDIDRIDLAVNG